MFNYIRHSLKKTPKYFYTIGTILAAAQINYAIVNNSFVYVALLVMLAHELAHYFSAKSYGAKVFPPIFIPLPFFVIGLTRASKLKPYQTKKVAAIGPIVGFLSATLLILLNTVYGFVSFLPLFGLAIGEIILNYFGTDGSKYRQAKKEMQLCIS